MANRDNHVGSLAALVEYDLQRAMKAAKMVERVCEINEKVTFKMDLLPVKIKEIEDRPWVFIPTGTKESPAGISTTDCKYVIMMDKDEEVLVFSLDIVKAYIRKKAKSLDWRIDEWYEVMGFELSLADLIMFEAAERGGKDGR